MRSSFLIIFVKTIISFISIPIIHVCGIQSLIPWQFMSVMRGSARSASTSSHKSTTTNPHEFEHAYIRQYDIINQGMQFASPVVVLKYSNNSILVSYLPLDNDTSSLSLTKVQPIHRLLNTNMTLIMTGMIGDCRLVRKSIDKSVLEYIRDFDKAPTASYIANEMISNIFLKYRRSLDVRPLILHCYLIDRDNNVIYDVDPLGVVDEVDYGVAGRHASNGMDSLDDRYYDNMTLNNATDLASEVLLYEDPFDTLRKSLHSNDSESHRLVPKTVMHRTL